jgi:hypothetical protein
MDPTKQGWNPSPEAFVRLSPNKIEFIADETVAMLEKEAGIHIQTNADLVFRVIVDIIFENMKAEEAIDEEVDELLAQYKGQISAMEMDFGSLRSSMKREIIKKKGFIL